MGLFVTLGSNKTRLRSILSEGRPRGVNAVRGVNRGGPSAVRAVTSHLERGH